MKKVKQWLEGEVGRVEFYVVFTVLIGLPIGYLVYKLWRLETAITLAERILGK